MLCSMSQQTGSTALHYAAGNGHSEIVKVLLGAGATDSPDKVYIMPRFITRQKIHCNFGNWEQATIAEEIFSSTSDSVSYTMSH